MDSAIHYTPNALLFTLTQAHMHSSTARNMYNPVQPENIHSLDALGSPTAHSE